MVEDKTLTQAQSMLAEALRLRWSIVAGETFANKTIKVSCYDLSDADTCLEAALELCNLKNWRIQFLLDGKVAAELAGPKWKDRDKKGA